jgi:CDP-diacylglycerol--glycerol-3-phosphate 3-phosphatidyltransferase
VPAASWLLVLGGLLAAAVLSMLVYTRAGRRRDADAVVRGSQFLSGAGDFLVHWFLWLLWPLDRAAARFGLGPGFFNLAGLACGALSGGAIATGCLEWGGVAIAAGGVCDLMDGRVARARGVASDYGKFIDATLDRFVEAFVLLGFVVFLAPFRFGPLLAAAALAGSLLVSYARARGETVGVLCREGLMQRAERLVLATLACLGDGPVTGLFGLARGTLALWVVGLIAVATLLTAAHRTLWIARRVGRG